MGWCERVKKASAGQRVTSADERHAMAVLDELIASNAERDRLTRDGLVGVATITDIRQNLATTGGREPLGASSGVSLGEAPQDRGGMLDASL